MKYVKQFSIILVISFIGEILNSIIPLPIPASIYGIVLMFICLKTKIFPYDSVKKAGNILIEIMPMMFIPAAVGLIEIWGVLQSVIVPYILVIIITSILVMVVSGHATQFVINHKRKKEEDE